MPNAKIQNRFRNAVSAAIAKVGETAELGHAGLKGRFREIFVADLLQQVLSSDFLAGSGLVVDHVGGESREADVVIFDKFHIPAVLYQASEGLFPIEGVYYYGEIKSRLTREELRDAVEKFRRLRTLVPLPDAQGRRFWPPRFLFAWSSDLKGGGIEGELDRYCEVDQSALTDPAGTILCVVGKGYCHFSTGRMSWEKIGSSDGVQEVVNFIGGVANSLIELRMQKFGVKFGHYIIPEQPTVKLKG